MVFSADVGAFTIHEDVHVIAWYRIGETHYSLLGEGLAVDMEGQWWGDPLLGWASTYKSDGTLPSLADLDAGFQSELGVSHSEVEAAWIAAIP